MSRVNAKRVEESRAWKVNTFGDLRVSLYGNPLPVFSNRKVAQLLLLLASKADRPISRDVVAETLWASEYLEIAKDRLRQTLALLNKHFKDAGVESPLEATRTTICLTTQDCEVDLVEFYDLVTRQSSDHRYLLDAVAMIVGPVGEGFVEEWIKEIRDSTVTAAVSGIRSAIDQSKEEKDYEALLKVCDAGLQIAPLDDGFNFERVTALIAMGRGSEALLAKKTYEEKLQKQLGLKPSAHWQSTSFEAAPAPQDLKNAQHWVSLSQPVDHFFGRDVEIERLNAIFDRQSAARLATITGQGGAGKTRLSLEFVRQLNDDAFDRIIAIGLADYDSVGQLAHAIAEAFEVVLFHEDGLAGLVASMIGESRTLFVLDNCEHLLPEVTAMVRSLVTECPTLSVLCSSRTRLGVHGERELALEPLVVPTEGDSHDCPVVQLLIDRIQSRDHSYHPDSSEIDEIVQLCRLLEGVPLAVELAASQTDILSVRELRQQLEGRVVDLANDSLDMPQRHLALRNTLSWGFERLSPDAQKVLSQMSLFPGSWKLADAEPILGRKDLIAIHEELKKAALIGIEPNSSPRQFRMLEMVRQYARPFLSPEDEKLILNRHYDHFSELGKSIYKKRTEIVHKVWVADFRSNLHNFRFAIQTGLKDYDSHPTLGRYILFTTVLAEPLGLFMEWSVYAKRALEFPTLPDSDRGLILAYLCHVEATTGKSMGIPNIVEEVVKAIDREPNVRSRRYMVNQVCQYITVNHEGVNAELGLELIESVIDIDRTDDVYITHLLGKIQLLHMVGRSEEGLEVAREASRKAEEIGALREFIWSHIQAGLVYTALGDGQGAIQEMKAIMANWDRIEDQIALTWMIHVFLESVTMIESRETLDVEYLTLWAIVQRMRLQAGITLFAGDELVINQYVAVVQARLRAAAKPLIDQAPQFQYRDICSYLGSILEKF